MPKFIFDRPDLLIRELATEALAIAALLTILVLARRHVSTWIRAAERGLGRIARRRGLSITLVGLLALGASAILTLAGRMPQPLFHDEFSYLLAADTFAHGRLSNPTHPLSVHFESMHIIQEPTYASKYPPAQGLMLAAGQVIGGNPIVGVWLGTALACAALCWMLLAWFPPWLAILGALLAALHPGILLVWGQSYWGGNVAATGGALVFGGLRRIVRRPRVRDAALLGLGLALLANSRPYEGLVASLPVAVVLLAWMLGKNRPAIEVSIKRVALPVFMILALTVAAMGFYNVQVTGDVLKMPYLTHEETYSMAPIFLWQGARPAPAYRHESLRFHQVRAIKYYRDQRSVQGFLTGAAEKAKELWKFYQGSRGLRLVLTLPLLALPWVLKDRWPRFALLTCGVLTAGMALSTWVKPHYAAPITGLVCLLLLQAMRRLRLWRWRGRPMGRSIAWAIWVIAAGSFLAAFVEHLKSGPESERARIVAQLRQDGRRHLVIVPQGPLHRVYWKRTQEWVYNGADIDGAQTVWARGIDRAHDRKLMEYFKDREVWLLEADQDDSGPKLLPYPLESRP